MAEEVKDISISPDEGIESQIAKATSGLRAQLEAKQKEADEARRVAADRDQAARDANAKLAQATVYTTRTEHSAIANALAEAEARGTSLERDLAAAIETADGKAAAAINKQIAALESRKLLLEQGKSRIEEEIENDKQRAEQAAKVAQQRPAVPQGDQFESMVRQLPPNQQAWIRQHKDRVYVPGQGLSQKALGAYHLAKGSGLAEDSPQLLAFMDKVLGHTAVQKPAEAQEDASQRFVEVKPEAQQQAQPQQQQQRRAVPAAPPSRAAGGGTQRGGVDGRLTAAQAQTAERMGMSHKEYLDNARVLIKAGKLPASFLQ